MDQNSEMKNISSEDEKAVGISEPTAAEVGSIVEQTALETSSVESVEQSNVEASLGQLEVDTSGYSIEELLAYLQQQVESEILPNLQDMKRLKRMLNNDTPTANDDEELDEEEDNGEERLGSQSSKTEMMSAFLNLRTRYHELEAKKAEEEKAERENNYQKKLELIRRLEENLDSTDDFFKVRNEFENIRAEWKTIGQVPENNRSEVIGKYSKLLDTYYEMNKLNKEAQEYDFKHNRKEKESFIERAKALADEPDVVKAFRELQNLHDMWKETGPVAPEFRDLMWKEFKDASVIVNKRHDDYFKQLHEQEEKNHEVKVKIVEQLENMLIKTPTTRDAWRTYEKEMDQIREQWKSAGRVPRSKVNDLRMRFRVAVDEFYLQRRNFMKELSEKITPRLERMRELVSEADSLKDSKEWKATTKKLQDLQKEWTEVSQLGTRVAEAQKLWRQFRTACDKFFKSKSEEHTSRMASREENLEKKLLIVEKIEALVAKKLSNPAEELAAIEAEWNAVGPVPNEKKDDVLNRYYSALRALKGEPNRRRTTSSGERRERGQQRTTNGDRSRRLPKVNMTKDLTELSNPELRDEMSLIKRNISQLEEELLQYENNIGFFNASPDNPMVKQIQEKIDTLRDKITTLEERLKEIKAEIKNPSSVATEVSSEVSSDAPQLEETSDEAANE